MAGHEHASLGIIAMGQRNAGVGGAPGGGSHARHYLKRDTGRHQGLNFLAATPEDKRIAALQPQHPPTLQGQIHQQLIDIVLRPGVMVRFLADKNSLYPQCQQLQNGRSDQPIVYHDIGLLHQTKRLKCQ